MFDLDLQTLSNIVNITMLLAPLLLLLSWLGLRALRTTVCPHCAERIRRKAQVCRYCRLPVHVRAQDTVGEGPAHSQ